MCNRISMENKYIINNNQDLSCQLHKNNNVYKQKIIIKKFQQILYKAYKKII